MILILLLCLAGSAFSDFRCSFDQGKCGFRNPHWSFLKFQRRSGPTPSADTGPNDDHTTGSGHYMYVEASKSGAYEGDVASLVKKNLKFTGSTCVTFWYHMYGVDVGSLEVYVGDKSYFSKSGDNGNQWKKAYLPIAEIGTFSLYFDAYRGKDDKSDIAIDDIHVGQCTGGGTPQPPITTPPPPTNAPTPAPPTNGPTPPPPSGTVAPPPPGSCGLKPSTRIVGGADAKPGDWPWQAGLMYRAEQSPFCGGTLVHPQWIVTATHCLEGESASNIKIRLGGHERTSSNANSQDINAAKIIRHPSYEKPIISAHDLSLIKLDRPAVLNAYVNLACLPEIIADPVDGTNCFITGWGRLASGGDVPKVLQAVSVPIVSKARCDRAYPKEIHDSMICAGLDAGGKDSCQGDSGGPLVCESGGRFYLHGATSWGYGCAAPGKFGVYARVKYLMSWIKTQMAKN